MTLQQPIVPEEHASETHRRVAEPPTNVIPFRRPPPCENRFGVADRIETLRWESVAQASGIRRVVLECADPGEAANAVGEFLLVYRHGVEWASWGITSGRGRYHVWETAFGQPLGLFERLTDALGCVLAAAQVAPPGPRVKQRSTLRRQAARAASDPSNAQSRPPSTAPRRAGRR